VVSGPLGDSRIGERARLPAVREQERVGAWLDHHADVLTGSGAKTTSAPTKADLRLS